MTAGTTQPSVPSARPDTSKTSKNPPADRPGKNPSAPPARRTRTRWQRMRREWQMYVFIVPGVLFFLVFKYLPMAGNVVAFQDYSPFRGIFDSDFVGLENFQALLTDGELMRAVINTLIIAALQIVFSFPAPILLALLLNSLISDAIKRTIQTVVYLPHFISWVIVISIWQKILGGTGITARLFEAIGLHGVNLMTNPDTFKFLVVAQVIWKDVGWGTIIFFAAIAAIPTELYESAAADGAGAWRRIWHITLPGLIPVISLLLILTIGNVLTVGFEQLLLQQPAVGANAAQVIDTFVYFRGVAGGDWGLSAAAGLIKGVIATVLVLGANRLAKRLGTGGIF
jgi:putative aldouronate transport system permease protein